MTDPTAVDVSTLTGLDALRLMPQYRDLVPNIGGLLGMETEVLEQGRIVMSLTPRAEFSNPLGAVHGGICATLLDSVMGCAVHSTLPAGVGYTTLELKVNYIRTVPTTGGKLTATGTIIHIGRRTATAEGSVLDSEGRLVAHGSTTCMILPLSV